MESFESFEQISGRKFSLGLEAGAGDIGAIVTAGTAWGPAKRDNRIDWGSGAEPGTVSPHLGLVLPASPLGQGAPERTLEGPQNGQSGQQQLEAVSRKELTEGKPAFHSSYLLLPPLPVVAYFFQDSVLFSTENTKGTNNFVMKIPNTKCSMPKHQSCQC